jgi:hypothetical protein
MVEIIVYLKIDNVDLAKSCQIFPDKRYKIEICGIGFGAVVDLRTSSPANIDILVCIFDRDEGAPLR